MTDQQRFCCPGCKKFLNIPVKYAGHKVKRPKCETVFRAGRKDMKNPLPTPPSSGSPDSVKPPAETPDSKALPPVQAELVESDPIPPLSILSSESSTEFTGHSQILNDRLNDDDRSAESTDIPLVSIPAFKHRVAPTSSFFDDSELFDIPTTSTEMDPFEDLADGGPPVANVARSQSPGMSRKAALARGKQKARSDRGEMDEMDQKVQSAGLFLIFLPLIASVLPLFGRQLRRLARSGEFAPVAATFLGLIGAGCIAYAHRNRGNSVLFGGGAAAFVLLTGVTGFMVLRNVSPDPSGGGSQPNRLGDIPSVNPGPSAFGNPSLRPTHPSPSNSSRRFPNQQSPKPIGGGIPLNGLNTEAHKRVLKEQADARAAAAGKTEVTRESNDRFARNARDRMPQSSEPRMTGQSPFQNRDIRKEVASVPDVKDAPDATPDNEQPENPFVSSLPKATIPVFVESLPLQSGNGPKRSEIHRRWGSGMMAFSKYRRSKNLEHGLRVSESIGTEQQTGLMFSYRDPIQGVEVIKIGPPEFIPVTVEDTPTDNAIKTENGQRLAGFNLAFDVEEIVGIQGIFIEKGQDGNAQSESVLGHWLGMQTDDIQQVRVKSGSSIHGFICYTKGLTTTGFALLYK